MKNTKLISAFLLLSFSQLNASTIDEVQNKIEKSSEKTDCYGASVMIDNKKTDMDVLKIISPSDSIKNLIGVFHTGLGDDGHNAVFLVKNTTGNLCSGWSLVSKLSSSGSMGYLYPYQNGFIFSYEHESNDGNTVAIGYYPSYDDLVHNKYTFQYWLDKNVYLPGDNYASPVKNMGTPDIESVSGSSDQILFKLHYYPYGGDRDIPAYGSVNIPQNINNPDIKGLDTAYGNSAQKFDTNANNAIRVAGGSGKIGERDWFFYDNQKFYIYEAQTCTENYESDDCWASWRLFLYSPQDNKAVKLTFDSCGTNAAFANPHTTVIGGKLILSAFIPYQTKSQSCNTPGEFIRSINL